VNAPGVRQAPPQIWPAQIFSAVARGTRGTEHADAQRPQRFAQSIGIELGEHGIARLGMGEPEIQQFTGWQTAAAAPEGNARVRHPAELVPRIVLNHK
jgi:hypothetical protein